MTWYKYPTLDTSTPSDSLTKSLDASQFPQVLDIASTSVGRQECRDYPLLQHTQLVRSVQNTLNWICHAATASKPVDDICAYSTYTRRAVPDSLCADEQE